MSDTRPPATAGLKAGDAVRGAQPRRGGGGPEGGFVRRRLPALAAIAVVLLGWELGPRLGLVSRTSAPPLSEVLVGLGNVLGDPQLYRGVGASAGQWGIGLLIAVLGGTAIGLAMGRVRLVHDAVDPILGLLYPVPKVALVIPLQLILIQVLGSTEAPKAARISVIALGCLLPVTVSAYHGAAGVEPKLLWSSRAAGVGGPRRLVTVVLPAALPQVLSGIRIALAVSLFTLVGSEMLLRDVGVGTYLFNHYNNGNFPEMWAVAMLLAVFGFVLDVGYARIVRLALPWWEGDV